MKTLVLRILFTAIALVGLPTTVLAIPVLWTLNGVTFTDGGTASGTFVYDADTNTDTAVNITTTAGSAMTGSTYAFVCLSPCAGPGGYTATSLLALTVPSTSNSLAGVRELLLGFTSALTNAGGTVSVSNQAIEFTCADSECSFSQTPSRAVSGGSIIGVALTPIVYTVDVPGVLTGTITTDGTIGSLARQNIIAWNLTATLAGPSGSPLIFAFNSASPGTGTEVVCGGGGCGIASTQALTFQGASLLELGLITSSSPPPLYISFTATDVHVVAAILQGNPGTVVQGPATLGNQPSPDLNQHGLTGSWYELATSGQGLEFEIYPSTGTGLAFVSWFTFDTVAGGEDSQRWYTVQGPVVTGQPNASLTIYQNTGGNFNAPPATTASAVGTATLSFFSCSSGQFSYSFTDGTGRTGTITFTRLTQNVTCSTTTPYATNADFAFSGNWFDSTIPGQGFTIEVNPVSGILFAAWYTYEPGGVGAGAAGQRWYTAQASFTAGTRSIPVTLYETTGGVFDTPTPSGQKTVIVGSGTLAFQSCTAATFSYSFSGGTSTGLSGTINLSRVGPVPPGCTS